MGGRVTIFNRVHVTALTGPIKELEVGMVIKPFLNNLCSVYGTFVIYK